MIITMIIMSIIIIIIIIITNNNSNNNNNNDKMWLGGKGRQRMKIIRNNIKNRKWQGNKGSGRWGGKTELWQGAYKGLFPTPNDYVQPSLKRLHDYLSVVLPHLFIYLFIIFIIVLLPNCDVLVIYGLFASVHCVFIIHSCIRVILFQTFYGLYFLYNIVCRTTTH